MKSSLSPKPQMTSLIRTGSSLEKQQKQTTHYVIWFPICFQVEFLFHKGKITQELSYPAPWFKFYVYYVQIKKNEITCAHSNLTLFLMCKAGRLCFHGNQLHLSCSLVIVFNSGCLRGTGLQRLCF